MKRESNSLVTVQGLPRVPSLKPKLNLTNQNGICHGTIYSIYDLQDEADSRIIQVSTPPLSPFLITSCQVSSLNDFSAISGGDDRSSVDEASGNGSGAN